MNDAKSTALAGTTTIQVISTNRTTRILGTIPQELADFFRFHPNGYRFMRAYKEGHWDGWIRLLKYGRLSTGLFLAMKDEAEKSLNVKFYVTDQRVAPKFNPLQIFMRLKETRQYQLDCVDAMIAASATGGLVVNATGSGKTAIAGLYLSALEGLAVFIVDELTLLTQAQTELERTLGETVGTVGESVYNPQRITVATIQTLSLHQRDPRFQAWFKSLAVVIVDEVHTALNSRTFQTMISVAPAAVFGLTATLDLKKDHIRMPAYQLAGPLIYSYSLVQGQADGYLAEGIVISVPYTQRLGGKVPYQAAYQWLISVNEKRNELIEKLARASLDREKYVVILVERIDHIYWLDDVFQDITHEIVYGGREKLDRIAAKNKFEDGEVRLIIASRVFKKGIDIKRLDVIIDATGMKSSSDAIQKFGRGVRKTEGKSGLIYYDVHDRGNRFEPAARLRLRAYRDRGIQIYRAPKPLEVFYDEKEVKRIVELADRKLKKTSNGVKK